MLIDNVNGLTHLTAHNGKVLVNGGKIVKEIWLTSGESSRDWEEVSELVLLTPQEQQQRLDDMQSQINEQQTILNDMAERWNDKAALQARIDELGKPVQTEEGDGTDMNPYRNFKIGDQVEAGKWYYVPDPSDPENPYLWQAIATGTPTWEKDSNYFDIPAGY